MLLREDPVVWFGAPTKGFLAEARGEVAESDDTAACLRSGKRTTTFASPPLTE